MFRLKWLNLNKKWKQNNIFRQTFALKLFIVFQIASFYVSPKGEIVDFSRFPPKEVFITMTTGHYTLFINSKVLVHKTLESGITFFFN